MPDKKEQFNAANARRLVLVADDELINRELLGNMLEDTCVADVFGRADSYMYRNKAAAKKV